MNKFILLTSLLVGYAYAMEFFIAWYSGNQYEMAHFLKNRPTGPYYWAWLWMVIPNVHRPAALLVQEDAHEHPGDVRRVDPHQHRHVVRALRHHRLVAQPRLPAELLGPVPADDHRRRGRSPAPSACSSRCFLLFMRWLPMVSMTEVKGTMPQADPHRHTEDEGAHDPVPIAAGPEAAAAAAGALVPEGAE